MGGVRGYLALFLAWSLIGLFYLSQDVARRYFFGDPKPWGEVSYWALRVFVSAALTPGILWLGRRWPIEQAHRFQRILQHLLASACFAFLAPAVETAVILQLGNPAALSLSASYGRSLNILLIFEFHANIISYWVILGIQSGFRYYRKYEEREQQALRLELHASELKAQLAGAQLRSLKMQLEPHFLFNTLNAITVLVRQQRTSEAEETLARLSDLLRAVLSEIDAQEVPLSRELEYLRLYLAIEQVRFSDRLEVRIDIDPEAMDAAVPPMSLQPIVENAVRHGIAKSAAGGFIAIDALPRNGQLEITVTDSGPGITASGVAGHKGIGLSNTRARLQTLYGNRASLTIASGERGGAAVTLSIPFHFVTEICS